jgi:hypothetical protein
MVGRAGIPHRLTSARIAQLHRWQLLGAAARKGRRTAQRDIYRANRARYHGPHTVRALARATAWGTSKLVLPTSLVTPVVPGYQPGDRTYRPPRGK